MTRDRTKLLLDNGVLQAWADGKEIQVRDKTSGFNTWHGFSPSEQTGADFENDNLEWRVKPEPRRWWVNIYDSGYSVGLVHNTKEQADQYGGKRERECIEVVEVIK